MPHTMSNQSAGRLRLLTPTCSVVLRHYVSLAGEEQDIVCIHDYDNVLCW